MALLLGYGASAINPYLAFEIDRRPGADKAAEQGRRRGPGSRELHQGAVQGPAQDHVQDGHLHPAQLPRRAGLRGRGAEQRRGRHGTSRAPPRASRASGWTRSPPRPTPATRRPADVRHCAPAVLPSGGHYSLPQGRRAPPVDAGDHPPSCSRRRAPNDYDAVPEVRRADQRPGAAAEHPARAVPLQADRGRPARGGRARGRRS